MFPKVTKNYDAVLELLEAITNIESPDELSRLKDEDMQFVLKIQQSRKEDAEWGYSD